MAAGQDLPPHAALVALLQQPQQRLPQRMSPHSWIQPRPAPTGQLSSRYPGPRPPAPGRTMTARRRCAWGRTAPAGPCCRRPRSPRRCPVGGSVGGSVWAAVCGQCVGGSVGGSGRQCGRCRTSTGGDALTPPYARALRARTGGGVHARAQRNRSAGGAERQGHQARSVVWPCYCRPVPAPRSSLYCIGCGSVWAGIYNFHPVFQATAVCRPLP